jgi:hypothetical protein
MTTLHEQIEQAFADYLKESDHFETKGVKASAARARKALSEITKLAKERRKEIQDKKTSNEETQV